MVGSLVIALLSAVAMLIFDLVFLIQFSFPAFSRLALF